MDYQSIVTFVMEMAGSVAFAASGAMVGVERNMDIFGVSVLGVATAVGGGMIRDIVLGIIPPAVFTNPVYALVSVLASCIVFFIFYFKRELLQGHRRFSVFLPRRGEKYCAPSVSPNENPGRFFLIVLEYFALAGRDFHIRM